MINIAISSGKGGTGKTFLSTNIARALAQKGETVTYLDCDVEEPNGHLFLKPAITGETDAYIDSPVGVNSDLCTRCGKCVSACNYNALAMVKDKVLFFQNLCHACGACQVVCPADAIIEKQRKIGMLKHGHSGVIDFHYALLETAEGGMSPRLIKRVKEYRREGINILDSSPGTACPVVETVKDSDLCVLVTDPTPFGINDLKLAVNMCRELGSEPVVLVNRADYHNDELKDYCRREELEIIAEVPDDRAIAECYSVGDLVVDELPQYGDLFRGIADKLMERAAGPPVCRKSGLSAETAAAVTGEARDVAASEGGAGRYRELVVISGKGGTGKTSLTAGLCALERPTVISDCDVDAADLHLILSPEVREEGPFSGGYTAEIDPEKCVACGLCREKCRFEAIETRETGGRTYYAIDEMACEGCGVCGLVCPHGAVKIEPAVNGAWFVSDTRFGPMSHAKLGVAEENSGKLVSLVRDLQKRFPQSASGRDAVIDGSPGTGCPVIASLTGAYYALAVTEPTVSGVHDLKRILDVIRFFGVRAGVVVNKYDLNEAKTEEVRQIALERGIDFLGTIPYHTDVTQAQLRGLSVVEYGDGPVTQSLKEIWRTVKEKIFA